jgi:hypothetical protein
LGSLDRDLTFISNKRIGDPRVETATDIITMGLDSSLDAPSKKLQAIAESLIET